MTASSSSSEPPGLGRVGRSAARTAGLAVLVGGLIGALFSLMLEERLQRLVFDQWQNSAPREIRADQVAVVMIDDLALETVEAWPWPRYYIARLTALIAEQEPAAIGFDMIFVEDDPLGPAKFVSLYPEMDPALSAQIGTLDNMDDTLADVIGPVRVVLPRLGVQQNGVDPTLLAPPEPIVVGRPPAGVSHYPQVLAGLPSLEGVAHGLATINGDPDDDAS